MSTTPTLEPSATPIEQAVDALARWLSERADQPVRLADMADYTGYSAAHLQRAFTARLGLSPGAFHAACRERALRAALQAHDSVTAAMHAAGYGSTSRAYAGPTRHLGMPAADYRAGGVGHAVSYALTDSPLGRLMLAATDRGVCAVRFGDDDAALIADLRQEFSNTRCTVMPPDSTGMFHLWMDTLLAHLADPRIPADVPLDIRATAFQWRVWQTLQTIPAGAVRTYGEVAEAMGSPRAVRAVGSACGANPVAILIPCHRVIRGDGGLGGYRWGLGRKQTLLDRERRTVESD